MVRSLILVMLAVFLVGPVRAAPALKPEPRKPPELAGTTWVGHTSEGWEMTVAFQPDGTMTVSYRGMSFNRATWRQDGATVYWEMNDQYCEFNGKLDGNKLEGPSHNKAGKKWTTRMTRVAADR